jgi:hypothetical protein
MFIAKRQLRRFLRIVVLGVQLVRAARYGALDHLDGRKREPEHAILIHSPHPQKTNTFTERAQQATFIQRLDHFLNAGYYLPGNEPFFQARSPRAYILAHQDLCTESRCYDQYRHQ